MTTATRIAREFGDDGTAFTDKDGVELEALCEAMGSGGSRYSIRDDAHVHAFGDGSAIVIAGAAWDIRPSGCEAACWEGVGCLCGSAD